MTVPQLLIAALVGMFCVVPTHGSFPRSTRSAALVIAIWTACWWATQ